MTDADVEKLVAHAMTETWRCAECWEAFSFDGGVQHILASGHRPILGPRAWKEAMR
jgi:hypothetical protein